MFKPLVMEVLGRWGQDAREVHKRLVDFAVNNNGAYRRVESELYKQRVCFAMFKPRGAYLRKAAMELDLMRQGVSVDDEIIDRDGLLLCHS